MHRPGNVGKPEERESGSVEIKLNRHLVIEFCLIKSIGDNFRVIAIVVQLCEQIQNCHIEPIQKKSDNHKRLHPQLVRTGAVLTYCRALVLPVWIQLRRKSRKWLHHIALFMMECTLGH